MDQEEEAEDGIQFRPKFQGGFVTAADGVGLVVEMDRRTGKGSRIIDVPQADSEPEVEEIFPIPLGWQG